MTDLHTTRPSTLNNKIAVLYTSIIACIPLSLIAVGWLAQYISILAVVVVGILFLLYSKWVMEKISDYEWQLEIIGRMKRATWRRTFG